MAKSQLAIFDRKTLKFQNSPTCATLERELLAESEVEKILTQEGVRVFVNRERNRLDEIPMSELQGFWNNEACSHVASSDEASLSDFENGYMFLVELWSGEETGKFLIFFYHH